MVRYNRGGPNVHTMTCSKVSLSMVTCLAESAGVWQVQYWSEYRGVMPQDTIVCSDMAESDRSELYMYFAR